MVDAQTELALCNTGLDETQRLRLRVGVHLGKALIEDDNIFGDGAIIAAWLKAQTSVGGLSLSGTGHDVVCCPIDLAYETLGDQSSQNLSAPGLDLRRES